MPLHGEQLDELLSGYLDGQLEGDELQLVQRELESSESVRQQFADLKAQQSVLKSHFASQRTHSLTPDFTSRVLAELNPGTTSNVVLAHSNAEATSNEPSSRTRRLAFAVLAIAAVLLLAVSLPPFLLNPQNLNPQNDAVGLGGDAVENSNGRIGTNGERTTGNLPIEDPGTSLATNGDENGRSTSGPLMPPTNPFRPSGDSSPADDGTDGMAPGEDGAKRYVSQIGGVVYIMMMDVEMTRAAADRGELDRILNMHGIPRDAPILANEGVADAIRQSRTIVANGGSEESAMIYLLRADMDKLGKAIDAVYMNVDDFPNVAFDMAFDSRNTKLLQTIAESTGTRFAIDQKFAAPIALKVEDADGTPIEGFERPAEFVSIEAREKGFGEMPAVGAANGAVESFILLVRVRN